jgi:hypothetical protein
MKKGANVKFTSSQLIYRGSTDSCNISCFVLFLHSAPCCSIYRLLIVLFGIQPERFHCSAISIFLIVPLEIVHQVIELGQHQNISFVHL